MVYANIAYIHYWEIPSLAASSVHVMKMCQAFQQEGYTTSLHAPRAHMSVKDIWQHYGIQTRFALHLMHTIPLLRKQDIALRASIFAYRQAHTVSMGRNLAGAMWSSLFGVPTLFESHELPHSTTAQFYTRQLFRGTGFKGLIVISPPLKERYLQHYGDLLHENDIHVEPDAVDLERFQMAPTALLAKQQLGIDNFVVGYVGHLYPGRGIEQVIALAQNFSQITFLIVGGTETDLQHWQKQTVSLDNIRFTGFVPNGDLVKYMASMDVFLMPYQQKVTVYGGKGNTSEWMSPMKMFEYMAGKRPIISSNLPALRTILNQHNAILCPPEDTKAWVSAVQSLYENQTLRQQLAEQAYQDVQYYTWCKRVQRIMRILD
jgi:glycosyltransferase involved in cell wall biosynthesis